MHFRSFLDNLDNPFGSLDIETADELAKKYQHKIQEITTKNKRNGKYVGYTIDINRKFINIILEKKVIRVNFDFKTIAEEVVL